MRCSALPLASKCRGSYNLTKSHGSIHSRLGTAFHALARAKVLKLANPMDSVRVTYGLTDEEVKDMEYCLYNITINIPPDALVIADDTKLEGFEGKLTGTPDLVVFQPKEGVLTLPDWKSGYGDVEPPDTNNQLIGYAIMTIEELERRGYTVNRVNLFIIQPRLNVIKPATFTRDQLMALAPDIRKIIEESEKPDAEFTTGPWCNSCFKCFNCPAFAGEIRTLMTMYTGKGEIKGDNIQQVIAYALPFGKACGTIKTKIENLAKAWVDQNGDLELGGGQKYSRIIGTKKVLDARKTFKELNDWFTEDERWSILSASAAKVGELCKEKKRGLSTIVTQALIDRGAITEELSIRYMMKKEGEKEDGE